MPAKGRRIASRQSQLNRRRRQQSRKAEESATVTVAAPSDIPPETPAPDNGSAAASTAIATPAPTRSTPASRPQRAPAPVAAARTDRAAAYTHLGSEIRRILTLAAILLAVLIGLSVVL